MRRRLGKRRLPSRRVPAHRTYSPALLANGRRRYEQTAESVASIAADFGIHHYSLIRLAKREGWVRYQRPPRDLSVSARLLEETEKLEASLAAAATDAAAPAPEPTPAVAATIDRLYRVALGELAALEALRAQLGTVPQKPLDAARTTQTLSNLTEVLGKLQRMQAGMLPAASERSSYDDLPADLDQFRLELARRIDALFQSEPDRGTDAAADAARGDQA